jgi:hypothetical protein
LDPVAFARQLGFEPDAAGAGLAVAVEAAAVELLAAMGQELRIGDRGAVPGVVPAGIKPRGDGRNKSLVLPNKSRIVGVPSNQTTVRGFSGASTLIFDEAAHARDELYLAMMRPVLAASGGDL